MKYDFTTIMDRQGRDSIAVEKIPIPGAEVREGFDRIPMWVADMNFPACPAIPQAIIDRVRHPAYGYFDPSPAYFDAIIRWQEDRHGVTGLKPEHIGYENGVLGGVATALSVFCSKGDAVLVHAPTYVGFTGVLTNNGYRIVHSPLKKDAGGVWRMDFEDMEKKIVENKIHAAIFCSPHNPTGRVWERWEIEKAMEVYARHDVFVISDEIWSDLILTGYEHVPTQSVSDWAREHVAAMYAPSKTFNLAGLIGAYHIVYDPWIRERMEKESSLCHYNDMNVLSMHALIAAYGEEGRQWCDELCQTLTGNVDYGYRYIQDHFRGVEVSRPQGTYMLYLDCAGWLAEHGMTMDDLQKAGVAVGVIWQDGRPFQCPNTIRMNLALPLSRVKEAFDRLDKYVFNP